MFRLQGLQLGSVSIVNESFRNAFYIEGAKNVYPAVPTHEGGISHSTAQAQRCCDRPQNPSREGLDRVSVSPIPYVSGRESFVVVVARHGRNNGLLAETSSVAMFQDMSQDHSWDLATRIVGCSWLVMMMSVAPTFFIPSMSISRRSRISASYS